MNNSSKLVARITTKSQISKMEDLNRGVIVQHTGASNGCSSTPSCQ